MDILTSPNFWSIIITGFFSVIMFFLNKKYERDQKWKEKKLELYLQFMSSLSGITDTEHNQENSRIFAKSCNDLHLFSHSNVINCLHKYQEFMAEKRPYNDIEMAITSLIKEIRKDLKIDSFNQEFSVKLWTSS